MEKGGCLSGEDPQAGRYGQGLVVALPVLWDEKCIGAFSAYYTGDREPTREEMVLVRLASALIAAEEKRQAHEGELRFNEQMLQTILLSSPLGISYVEQGRIKWTNPAMAQMFGTTLDDYRIDENIGRFYASEEDYRRVTRSFYECLSRGVPAQAEALLRRIDGSTFHGYLRISAVDPSAPRKGTITIISDITSRRTAEQALRESEERYRLLAENSFTGIYIHQDGVFVYVNNRLAQMIGCSPDDMIGQEFWDFVHPEDREMVKNRGIARSRGEQAPHHYEFRVATRNGETKWCELLATTVMYRGRTANMGSLVDITEHKRVQAALRNSQEGYKILYEQTRRNEELYRSLLDSSPDAIVVYDMEGRAKYVNSSFVRTFGWNHEELVGKRIPFLPDSEAETSMEIIRRLIHEGIPCSGFETRRFTKDGRILDVSISASRYHDHDGQPAGMLVILADITERKVAEDLLLQTERLKAVAELATGVAHNFNNLLQIVVGGAQLALAAMHSGNVSEATNKIEQILESSEFGSETVRRLQDFSRIGASKNREKGTVFDLSATARKAIEMSQPWWKTKPEMEGIHISLSTELGQDCWIRGHESQLFEVLLNLIKNAAEALPDGGSIGICCAASGDEVVMKVQDDGIGIPRANMDKVFSPFWTTKAYHATGMGLASCLGIVRQHHGDITVESEPGKGSAFLVRLPRSSPARDSRQPDVKREVASKLRVLIVDDVEPVLAMLHDGLSEYGQTVFTALSGKEAIEIFQRRSIDIVICDLGMPGMNGWQVARSIKDICASRGVPKTPFILLTGWGGLLDDHTRTLESGVNRIIEKPVVFTKLMDTVLELTSDVSQLSAADIRDQS